LVGSPEGREGGKKEGKDGSLTSILPAVWRGARFCRRLLREHKGSQVIGGGSKEGMPFINSSVKSARNEKSGLDRRKLVVGGVPSGLLGWHAKKRHGRTEGVSGNVICELSASGADGKKSAP